MLYIHQYNFSKLFQNNTPNLPPVKEGSYVRVYGIIRDHDNKKNVMIMKMLPVVDVNEITTHLLECIQSRTESESLAKRTVNYYPNQHYN